jgi:HAD superfamily hydrolase (TIGR01490 family)
VAPDPPRAALAFYDLDGTLVSSNVVTQYAWYARNQPSPARAAWRVGRLIAEIPLLVALELYSRPLFNAVFYRHYRGLRRDWLEANAEAMFEAVLRPAIYAGAPALLERDRRDGYFTVLVTGSVDFAVAPLVRRLGFDELIANRLVFDPQDVATGEIEPPLLAGAAKVDAMREMCRRYNVGSDRCRAYSDSISDLPMLEAVGQPGAANPGRRLRRIAEARGWPVLDLKARDLKAIERGQ